MGASSIWLTLLVSALNTVTNSIFPVSFVVERGVLEWFYVSSLAISLSILAEIPAYKIL